MFMKNYERKRSSIFIGGNSTFVDLVFSGWILGKGQKCIYPFLKQNILVTKKLVTATKPIKRFLYFFIAKGLAEMSPFLTSPFKAD